MTIEEIRAALAEVDRDIVRLVARRQALARTIGELKDKDTRALRDFAQEKRVLDRAREAAVAAGLAPEVAAALMSLLIESSLTTQERQRVAARRGGAGQSALVIGGSGRMGDWFVRFLASQGFEVEIADPVAPPGGGPHLTDWHASPLEHDLIVVGTPLRATAEILAELAERRPRGVVFDIGSLKSPLRAALQALVGAGVKVTSIHPMFGPDTELLSGRHVVLVDLGVPQANDMARALFASTMAELVAMDLDSHDRVVAYILGLSHALNIAFFTALAGSGEPAGHLAELSSATFDKQLAVASRVAGENPHLYFEIQHLNDYGAEALDALHSAVERLRSVVQSGDEPGFVALMEQGRRYFEGRSQRAGTR
jgi:chorismate mutase/prephenate dehydrogenase